MIIEEPHIFSDELKNLLVECSNDKGKLDIDKYNSIKTDEMESIRQHFKLTPRALHKIVCILKHDEIRKTCKLCGKPVSSALNLYCSTKCQVNHSDYRKKRNATIQKRYGGTYQSTEEYRKKCQDTCKKRYGVSHYSKTKEFHDKTKQTNLERYGVENPFQSEETKKKMKQTWVDKYGVDHPWKNNSVKQKAMQTNLERYGVENPFQSEETKKKMKQTWVDKYGVENPFQSEEIKEKMKQTWVAHYGEEHWTKTEEGRQKLRIRGRAENFELKMQMLKKHKNIMLLSNYNEFLKDDQIRYKCLNCGNEFLSSGSNIQRVSCPECSSLGGISIEEKSVLKYIQSIYSGEIVENTRKVIAPMEMDIYIPEKKFAIEFNGSWWHSADKVGKDYHLQKTLACQEKGIRLIHVFEWEWQDKRSICRSLIRSALGIFEHSIGARECKIIEMDSNSYKTFLEENHLQGAVNSSIRLALVYNGETVACAGWGKSRFKKDEMELHRFCIKGGWKVSGALSRLSAHCGIDSFVSYVDLAHFTGEGYRKAGFIETGHSEPSYHWCRGSEVLSRLRTQKHRLPELLGEDFNPDLTEVENMTLAGWTQVFDCGNLKMKWCRSS